jgi:hypothetical protein
MSEAVDSVIETIRTNRARFEAFCYSLTDEQLMRSVPDSTWVVRDFAAHLGTLDTALLNWFGAAGQGGPADATRDADGRPFDVDTFNDAQVAARRDWPLADVFAEAEANRRLLIDAMSQLTDEQIDKDMRFGGDAKRPAADIPLKTFLIGWAHHDPIHAADMLKALPERADDPELRQWLDNPFVLGYQAIMNRGGHGERT